MKTAVSQIITGSIIILFLLYFNRTRRIPFIGYGDYKDRKKILLHGIVGVLIGTVSIVFVWAAVILTENGAIGQIKSLSLFLVVIWIISYIVVAVEEEMFFRGLVMGICKQKGMPLKKGILVSSVIFAAAHLANDGVNLIAIINLALMGISFGLMYYYTKNLLMPIGFHFAWNFLQAMLGFSVSGFETPHIVQVIIHDYNNYNGGLFGPEAGIFTSIITIVQIALLYYWYSDKKKLHSTCT